MLVALGLTSVLIKELLQSLLRVWLSIKIRMVHHFVLAAAEVGQGFWNCPCVPMRERKECHCMLFLTPDNDFAGKDQTITSDEIKETTANM
ncbi:ferredoxin-thioredoxin reductase catalytic chain, chloroplastic isoform X2 [Arabidopsis lyrata subsp. lyrata]|uniref:ferredoxin-thioredoxin reductase catalytic chain, chloroplastic isoform X2 n=1 Tax=Arabidopsis lyrata subsp. lyrata TaxID=81972 RepID=UPI000A29D117|nr:ferredoxin-thioredoxin reductase catalytic chain, chloroplastic isoform X2 [Arabidopsis lyrata subsp. lyrata]|eukprot:XP_020887868.1 ferredoxin-thioredoxin reductase catalytic chain, chloroplastic isoform X2 [Arabidopsis lyrata subsp. lyrata]